MQPAPIIPPRINYGDTARLGVLVPSGNCVAEIELRAMLPDDIAMLTTRLALRGSSEAELVAMLNDLDQAACLLGDAEPDVIAFHCTAVSTFAPHWAGDITRRITAATGRPSVTTGDAILAALNVLGARRALLVTPYIRSVHEREIAFLDAHGVTVTGGSCLGVDTNTEMARIPPAAIFAQAQQAAATADADVCFISCTAIRSAGLIEDLEAALMMPVITSNQLIVWQALRTLGVSHRVDGFGQIFCTPIASASGGGGTMMTRAAIALMPPRST